MGPEDTFVLNVQSDLLDDAPTRLIVPLYPLGVLPRNDPRLSPLILIGDLTLQAFVLGTTALHRNALGPILASAEHARDEVMRALDMVLAGV